MAEKTDEEIAAQVQHGHAESFDLLMERYAQKLLRFGRKFLSSGEDIKDLVQEIFIKAYINIQSFDANRRFSPWIYRIAHNEFINAVKKKNREKVSFFDIDVLFPHPQSPETTDGEINKNELRRALDKCLGKLDSKYREPLILYYFEDVGYKDIAEILRIPVSTVGVRLQRGKAMLKNMIKRIDII